MTDLLKLRTVPRSTATWHAAWMLCASLALLASCTTPPKSAPLQSEPAEQPSAAQPQPADAAKPAETPPAEAARPTPAPKPPPPEAPAAKPVDLRSAKPTPAERVSIQRPQAPGDVKAAPAKSGQQPPRNPATAKQGGCGDKSRTPTPKPSPTGPHPRWVCKQPKITAEPVWAGEKVDFVFEIANQGEADLHIKLKGG